MKRLPQIQFIAAAIFIASLVGAEAQTADANQEIETTLRTYFTRTAARDALGVRAVLAGQFMALEADESARVHIVNTTNYEEILPPKCNDDIASLVFSFTKAEVSTTDPSVAVARFRLTLPQSEEQLAALKTAMATIIK